MERCVAIGVLFVEVCLFVYERLYYWYLELHYSEMDRATKYPASKVHVCSAVNEALSCLEVLLPYC